MKWGLQKQKVDIWQIPLCEYFSQEARLLELLNPDEVARANQFHFAQHRQRFVAAHGILREILSRYLDIAPAKIAFEYGQHGKPFLRDDPAGLQFNMSHSGDLALLGVTLDAAIGVDVELIKEKDVQGIAKRFFSAKENQELNQLPEIERHSAFFKLWTGKEAVIKAAGSGLYIDLSHFSVSSLQDKQQVLLKHGDQSQLFFVESFKPQPEYQAAVALDKEILQLHYDIFRT